MGTPYRWIFLRCYANPYHTSAGEKLWVITEADRSATTILLPREY